MELSVVKDKNAFLLSELIQDIKEMSEDYGLKDPPVRLNHTYQLKKMLISRLGHKVSISSFGNRDAVHSRTVDALSYSEATLKGHGLLEDDIINAFANLVRRKADNLNEMKWPPRPEEFLEIIEKSTPLVCIYNAIAWSINPRKVKNRNGYVEVNNHQHSEKIAAITQSWEGLVSKKRSPTSTALSLTLHRITGSREAASLLHKSGMGISYTDVRFLTKTWARGISANYKHILKKEFRGRNGVHITLDNSDGKQQTVTGYHKTHHTTGTIFQTNHAIDASDNEIKLDENIVEQVQDEVIDYGSYKIPKKKEWIPSFPEFDDKYADQRLLDITLYRDMAWAIVNAIGTDCVQKLKPDFNLDELFPIGSWTAFMKDTSAINTNKCKLEYLPVIPFPPSDNIVKYYMDMIIELAEVLELGHVFVHADEAINSKINMIIWMHQSKYDKIVPLLGGFHTLLVYLKILYKKYGCLGLQDWWVDSGAIADGSVMQSIEGRHYARGIRLHKQSFCALIRWRLQKKSPNDEDLIACIGNLRIETTHR